MAISKYSATGQKSVQGARKRLSKFLRTVEEVPIMVLEEERSRLYEEIVSETPYKTGKLESSVFTRVSRDKRRPGLTAGASARSKEGVNYAGVQHKNTHFKHPIKGKANYVRDPFNRSIKRIKRKLREKVKY